MAVGEVKDGSSTSRSVSSISSLVMVMGLPDPITDRALSGTLVYNML